MRVISVDRGAWNWIPNSSICGCGRQRDNTTSEVKEANTILKSSLLKWKGNLLQRCQFINSLALSFLFLSVSGHRLCWDGLYSSSTVLETEFRWLKLNFAWLVCICLASASYDNFTFSVISVVRGAWFWISNSSIYEIVFWQLKRSFIFQKSCMRIWGEIMVFYLEDQKRFTLGYVFGKSCSRDWNGISLNFNFRKGNLLQRRCQFISSGCPSDTWDSQEHKAYKQQDSRVISVDRGAWFWISSSSICGGDANSSVFNLWRTSGEGYLRLGLRHAFLRAGKEIFFRGDANSSVLRGLPEAWLKTCIFENRAALLILGISRSTRHVNNNKAVLYQLIEEPGFGSLILQFVGYTQIMDPHILLYD
ncbi:hypothetical protein SUGI_0550260 [Cryptomeria japonica]|nr:hypothetical protein SUGI_0550260 [Cryptomeria japonica]